MGLEDSYFEGKIEDIDEVSSDMKKMFSEIDGSLRVTCYNKLKKVLIMPLEENSKYKLKFSEELLQNSLIDNEAIKFNYNKRTYYISPTWQKLTSSSSLIERITTEVD